MMNRSAFVVTQSELAMLTIGCWYESLRDDWQLGSDQLDQDCNELAIILDCWQSLTIELGQTGGSWGDSLSWGERQGIFELLSLGKHV